MKFYNGWYEFLNTLNFSDDNILIYLVVLLVIIFIYWAFLRKQVDSVFDPFFLSVFTSATAACVPICMYLFGLIYSQDLFLNFILTELAYICGLIVFSFRYNKKDFHLKLFSDPLLVQCTYYVFSMSFIIIELIGFVGVGFPIFSTESRLAFYSGGWGIVLLCTRNFPLVIFILMATRWNTQKVSYKEKFFDYIMILFSILVLIGSGSKSAVLIIVFSLFFYKKYMKMRTRNMVIFNKYLKMMMGIAVIGVFIVLIIDINKKMGSLDFINIIYSFLLRLIGNGDIFGYFYADNFYGGIDLSDSFIYLIFQPLLEILRIISHDNAVESIGEQIWQIVNNSLDKFGPNSRHNVLGFLYFGYWGSIIFSFIIGSISSFVRNKMLLISDNIFVYIFMCELYLVVCTFPADIILAFSNFWSFCLINGCLFLISYWIYRIFIKSKIKEMD